MKFLPSRYLTVFVILIFSSGICEDKFTIDNKESGEISFRNCSENESSEKNCLNLELRECESRPINHGEKVETIVIPSPGSNYSKAQNNSLYNLQALNFLKKKYSFLSQSNLLISKTLHRSIMVNILRN